jgi:hypothetical protein
LNAPVEGGRHLGDERSETSVYTHPDSAKWLVQSHHRDQHDAAARHRLVRIARAARDFSARVTPIVVASRHHARRDSQSAA